MRNERKGGLCGKARQHKHRTRGLDMMTQEMISEYLYEDEEVTEQERYIPIGRRSEFVPTAADTTAAGNQLELPFDTREDDEALCFPRRSADRPRQHDADRAEQAAAPDTQRATAACTPPNVTRTNWRGLMFGCLVGGAAAAVVLMMIRVALG